MKYLNQSFTMPTCQAQISDLEYKLRVGLITEQEYLQLTCVETGINGASQQT